MHELKSVCCGVLVLVEKLTYVNPLAFAFFAALYQRGGFAGRFLQVEERK